MDVNAAIALSLSQGGASQTFPTSFYGEFDEDDELQRAIELSHQRN